ncbi:hypothetical protein GF373_01420, partial [bacterium]|nr:hypothetical protein [bacterium]
MNRFSSLSGKIERIRRDIENREDFAEEEPTVQCPHCDGYGNIIDQNGARLCSCVKKEILHSEFERALIPKRYLSEDLETFRAKTKEMQE